MAAVHAARLPAQRVAPMVGRLCQAADFQRLLATSPKQRSAHFVVHHLAAVPLARPRPGQRVPQKLSTDLSENRSQPVDDFTEPAPQAQWMGCVVPKRHARRAVTRNLLKRQMRAVFAGLGPGLPNGLWLLRLNRPFAADQFPSAASDALRQVARGELEQMLGRLSRGQPDVPRRPRPATATGAAAATGAIRHG